MTKLTKEQIGLLEKELKELENDKKNSEGMLILGGVVFIACIYFTSFVVQKLGNVSYAGVIGFGIGSFIGLFILSSKLSKVKENIKEVKFKLAGDKSWLEKEVNKTKEKTTLELWKEEFGIKNKEDKKETSKPKEKTELEKIRERARW